MQARLMVGLLALGTVAPAYQGQPAPAVEGHVVSQASSAPLKDAVVRLKTVPRFPGQTPTVLVQQTNEEGLFRFTNISPGSWELSAEKRGFSAGYYGNRKYDRRGRLEVTADGAPKDIVVKLVAQALIAGRVLDADGEPVEGVKVAVLKHGSVEVASATTLDNGEYRIARLTAGQYVVRCEAPHIDRAPSSSGVETGYAVTWYPNATDPSLAAEVGVKDGTDVSGIDIHLARVRLVRVSGRLQPPTGRGAGGYVALVDRLNPSKVAAESFTRSPDQRFQFSRVPAGQYIAYAYWVDNNWYVASQNVDVKDQDLDGLVLNPAVGEIRGSLKLKPEAPVVDLRKIDVELQPIELSSSNAHWNPFKEKISDDLQFRYPIPYQPLFTNFMVKVAELPEGCYIASIQYGGKDVPESGIEYAPGAPVEITIGCDAGRVEGRALGKDDAPMEGSVVALIPADWKGAVRSMAAGAGGGFAFAGIPPGDYTVLAWDDVSQDDLENPAFRKGFDSQAASVKVAPSAAAVVTAHVIFQ